MTASLLVPWRAGCPHREESWEWLKAGHELVHPDWEIIVGASPDGPFNRSAAILDAASRASGDILVVTDSDVWCDGLHDAVQHAETTGWAVPHLLIHRLSRQSTQAFLRGDSSDWRGLPLSDDNTQDRRPYQGNETGTLVVLRRDVLELAPPDPRFVGWGQEDDAWRHCLHVMVGKPWRGTEDLVHLWHPAQPRKNRQVGNTANVALYRRYRSARSRTAMSALIDEHRRSADARLASHVQRHADNRSPRDAGESHRQQPPRLG